MWNILDDIFDSIIAALGPPELNPADFTFPYFIWLASVE